MSGTIEQLLARLDAQDIRIVLDGEQLRVNAPKDVLTAELRAELKQRKEEIVLHLGRALGASSIAHVPRVDPMPLSHTQQRMWFMKQLDPDSGAYNVPGAMRLRGKLDRAALQRTIDDLVARHESLRTRFVAGTEGPGCIVEPRAQVVLEQTDFSRFPVARRDDEMQRALSAMARRPFDPARCPLLRALLLRVAADDHVFCLVLDHIVSDGVSMAILFAEFEALYTMHVGGPPASLPELPVQYLDYAEWQRRRLADGALARQLAYWKQQLGSRRRCCSCRAIARDPASRPPTAHDGVPRSRPS